MPLPPAFLIDLDGTLYTSSGPIPGAVETLAELRRRRVPFRLVTNTTRRSRQALIVRLCGYGFQVQATEIVTSLVAGAQLLRERGLRRIAPFVADGALADLSEFEFVGGTARPPLSAASAPPDAVVIGDLGDQWTPGLLNAAFRYVLDGAVLVALQKDRYWLGPTGLELDAGAYVAAIEYATGQQAIVCGKPEAAFYRAALASLGLTNPSTDAPGAVVIGDDLWADVAGAQRAGLQGWLVRTGKFRADVLAGSGVVPDRILGSIEDVIDAMA